MLDSLKLEIRIILNKNTYKEPNFKIKKCLLIALKILLIINKIHSVNNRKTLKNHFTLQSK